MSNNDLKHHLYDLYHDILDRFKFHLEQGKHNSSDALEATKQEMNILGNISYEEIDQTIAIVKDDLREISQQASELRQGAREIIEFDKQYITEEIHEKLMLLADSYTTDLLVFNAELAEHQHRGS